MINLLLLFLFLLILGKNPEQVLSEIYPYAKIEIKNIVKSDSQAEIVKELSGGKVETKLITFFIVKVNSKVKAYAYVDIQIISLIPYKRRKRNYRFWIYKRDYEWLENRFDRRLDWCWKTERSNS